LSELTDHLFESSCDGVSDAVALMAHCDRATRCFDENGWIKPSLKKTIPDMCKSQVVDNLKEECFPGQNEQ